MTKIKKIHALEILDSRGVPTVKTIMESETGDKVEAQVPSGSSAGKSEAWELRDGNLRYNGKGVQKAVSNVNGEMAKILINENPENQQKIDQLMMDLDGTNNKEKLGANAILSVSLAVAKLAAKKNNLELYQYLNQKFFNKDKMNLPTPFSVIIEAGQHSKSNLEVQEFMIVPEGLNSFTDKLEAIVKVFHELAKVLSSKGYDANVGMEGAYGPNLSSNAEAMDLIMEVVRKFEFGDKIKIALDVAASEFYSEEDDKKYIIKSSEVSLNSHQLLGLYEEWISKYPIMSIEDGLEEDDFSGWAEMNARFGDKIKIIGDDLSVTNPKRVKKGIEENVFSGCIIKPNQIGSLSETVEVIKMLKEKQLDYIISHRSGETSDTFIADLAVASGANYIKTGAPSRGERVAKYNRLLEIGEEIS